jgi:ornithine cyclodeaminase
METIALDSADVRHIIHRIGFHRIMDELIERLERAFSTYDSRSIVSPARSGFTYSVPQTGLLEWMPVMHVGGRATIKVVGYHPMNPARHNLPTIISTVSTYDTATGHLIGLADATFLTALRTGAASAIASKLMAHPGSNVVGLIGAGAQAVTQLHAIARVFDIEQVFVYDIDPAASFSFVKRTAFLELDILPVEKHDVPTLVAEADIICTCTSVECGHGPVFEDTGTKPWVHVNAVGSDFPGKVEVPLSLLRRSFICPDFPPQALQEGECQRLRPDELGPSLVELLKHAHGFKDVRHTPTVFDSTGWALEDHVALDMLLDYAHELGVGKRLRLESISDDPRDPYHFALKPATANGHVPVRQSG